MLLAGLSGPATAKRDLAVPPAAGWQHAASKLILMGKLGGLARTEIYDLGDKELDVVVQYATADKSTQATIYLFKPALASVPVWFDRSETQIRLRPAFRGVASRQNAPLAFPAPGASIANALRQSFSINSGDFKSTALAVMPIDDWLVVVRLSSNIVDEAQIDSKMSDIIGAIRFPSPAIATEAAVRVEPCVTSQKRFRARLMKPDMAQVLLGALIPQVEAKAVAEARRDGKSGVGAKPLCRDGQGSSAFGVYRTDDDAKAYTLAFGDAGRVATVSAGIALLQPNPGFQVILRDLDSSSVYPMFDKLPQPEQVLSLIQNQSPLSRTTGGDKASNITVSPSIPK
ncbi:hypothetical protein [Sphingomonas sp. SUN039]|uniref:hypothetical protein n=1 Tax=Sphingomonas sp. SUN039 TaxID=2937787 RepID=UPI0021641AFD|nr:hypothetical protein [Sphingomonas sp. SUN039]UVO55517.1 hypothetical protein M0209_15835 [Sphingomonas sp. SUN039]